MRTLRQALKPFKTKARPFLRSATVYVGLAIAALPDIAPLIQAHIDDIAHFVPKAWLDPSMRLLGLLVLIARARTLIKSKEAHG